MTRIVVGGVGLTVCAVAAVFALFFPIYGSSSTSVLVDKALELLGRITAPLQLGVVQVEMLANVLVFIPLGVFGAMVLPRWLWWVALLGGLVLSVAAETFQAVVLSSRVGSVRDVVFNVLGAAIGAFATWLVRVIVARRRTRVEASAHRG